MDKRGYNSDYLYFRGLHALPRSFPSHARSVTCTFVDFTPCRGLFFRMQEAPKEGIALRVNLGKDVALVPTEANQT